MTKAPESIDGIHTRLTAMTKDKEAMISLLEKQEVITPSMAITITEHTIEKNAYSTVAHMLEEAYPDLKSNWLPGGQ